MYLMSGFDGQQELLAQLGPHKTGKSCLYVRDLERIDLGVLRRLIARSLEQMDQRYPPPVV
jgi:hypothetical protein